ncbi:phosphoglycerate kinase [Candidatus Kuenenbacteria bacterium RIFCSPHIGHO2_02_FULL_39_13]|uniref:Phosphoglycerate kinase n=1 Tax=Candidatus Kuenenbacteria bacterium RIFCSPHIGHO2_02_FULL_39_13 TaxID=1798561 RepID=A0A1F6FP20_9BACT|nr:MAG: phosphoglycerate kinase [Candidatus Kuenenbacteria bacterium RIFCSPHIGHO2_02_FULL_39_13]
MKFKSLKYIRNLAGKRVLVRCDFDLPMKNCKIIDDTRLKACVPTIKYLLFKGAKVVLVGHLGRPKGVDEKLSLLPVKNKLEKILEKKIVFIDWDEIPSRLAPRNDISLRMLENLRFYTGEEKNSKKFAKKLASLADIYVNEAFAVSHRSVASVDAIQNYLPSYAGLRLEKEIENLSAVLKNPKHPVILIIGGAKIETKLPVIKEFQKIADQILVAGAVANTFLKAAGVEVGKSLVDEKYIDEAKSILNSKILLPVDWRVKNGKILDIGPRTIELFAQKIKLAKTIVWNGPMGKFEEKEFAIGTQEIAKEVLKSKAKVVIGGGDTDKILQGKKFGSNIFVSTGGGAMLEFLAGKKLPGFKRIFLH